MELKEMRLLASQLSGGTSEAEIKELVIKCIESQDAKGSRLLDVGAGKGELLSQLYTSNKFQFLQGIDLFERPEGLQESINWCQQDLNEPFQVDEKFDIVICSETIEHLENPRDVFRNINKILEFNGLLVMTMPNQESLRSYAGLIIGGHFAHFLGDSYPAHITALLRLDLVRICAETGFSKPFFLYTDRGGIPKLPHISWQEVSLGLLKGRLFSDNIAMIARKNS